MDITDIIRKHLQEASERAQEETMRKLNEELTARLNRLYYSDITIFVSSTGQGGSPSEPANVVDSSMAQR